ncbi:hypothetical protein J6X13_01895 [Candidatus Saccharibacteria bacterium]|nr:hypothetical protein [Candidatus Saccharibacteria bacterium]
MNKKGGKDVQSFDVNASVILTVTICFIIGALFVLCMIFFGMQIQTRAQKIANGSKVVEDTDIIGVSYESMTVPYLPSGNTEQESLIYKLSGGKSNDYYVVKTKSEYDTILAQVKDMNTHLADATYAVDGSLDVDENYFQSGYIIVFSIASEGLKNARVSSITRDEKYSLTAEIRYARDYSLDKYVGAAMFVKVPNIQPKNITVNYGISNYIEPGAEADDKPVLN